MVLFVVMKPKFITVEIEEGKEERKLSPKKTLIATIVIAVPLTMVIYFYLQKKTSSKEIDK